MSPWWLSLPLLAIVLGYFLRHPSLGLGLILGGGARNLIDLIRLGYVVDPWHIGSLYFNLADILIITGFIIILVQLRTNRQRST